MKKPMIVRWRKNPPSVTGYYWRQGPGTVHVDLAEVYIDPNSGDPFAQVDGVGVLARPFIDGSRWAGPLPVARTQEWQGRATGATRKNLVGRCYGPGAPAKVEAEAKAKRRRRR